MQVWSIGVVRIFKRRLRKTVREVRRLKIWIDPIWFPTLLAIFLLASLYFLGNWYDDFSGMHQGVYVEAVGATMDIIVFGVIIALFVFSRDRRLEISRQMELIDDFKKWNSDEARYRIAGAVRRLNRLGRTSIDFNGIEISDFSFRRHDIENIAGSTFYDGSWGTMGSKDSVKLEKVNFQGIDCRNVIFSKFNPMHGLGIKHFSVLLRDCNFRDTLLSGAVFRGAHLEWSDEPPDELGFWEDTEHGDKHFFQTHYPPFDCTDLRGVSFEDAYLQNADFRNAINIQDCEFRGACGLETCIFDNEEMKRSVLESAVITE